MLLAKTLRSSTFRVALLCVALFGSATAALIAYLAWATEGYLRVRYDGVIAAEERVLLDAARRDGSAALRRLLEGGAADAPIPGSVLLLADPEYRPLVGGIEWPATARRDGWVDLPATPGGFPPAFLRAHVTTLPDGDHLLIGKSIEEVDELARAIDTGIAATIALLLVIAGVAGLLVTRRTVGRIEAINATSRAIMASGLGKRIPLRGTRDEWDQLAANLNSMLARIEDLVSGIKQVSDNIAHDLRTPLMRMRARLELALRRDEPPEQYQALLQQTVSDLDDALKTFASLLRISAIEARDRTESFAPLDLAGLAAEVADLYDAAAEERGARVRFVASAPSPMLGDRDLLFEAIANLVDNAVKHGRSDVEVAVVPASGGLGPRLVVTDRGPGIPAAEHARVFRRFYRLEESRSTPGNGLGLSLVQAVAQLHGAAIRLESMAPGLRVTLEFPEPGLRPEPAAATADRLMPADGIA